MPDRKQTPTGAPPSARPDEKPRLDEDLLPEEQEAKRQVQAERERSRRQDPHPPGTEGD